MRTPMENFNYRYSQPVDLEDFTKDPARWLVSQAGVGNPSFLLAFADDGVIWGELKDGRLIQAFDIFGEPFPVLDAQTLQYARLFGALGEIRVFRSQDGFSAVRIEDVADTDAEAFTRSFILWGDSLRQSAQGWSWVEDGQLGIHQALPLASEEAKGRSYRLQVRYYVDYEPNHGQAKVAESRLVGIRKV